MAGFSTQNKKNIASKTNLSKAAKYNKYINYSFIGLAFSIPISKALTSILTALLILLWLLEGDLKNKIKIILKNPLSLAIIVLVGFSILAILWSSNTAYAIKFIRIKYWYFSPILIMLTSFRLSYTKYVFDAFLFSMFISEILSYGIYFNLWHFHGASHMFPTPFMPHVPYSIYLAFTIIIVLVKIYKQTNMKAKILLSLFFTTATLNLFINGGRTGQFAFVLILFVIAFIYYRHSYKMIFSSVAIAILVMPLAYEFSPNFHSRINQLYTDLHNAYAYHNYKGSMSHRLALWTVGIDKFLDHPITGSGIGDAMKNLGPYIKEHDFKFKSYTHGDHPDLHNNFIMYAAQLGVVGLFATLFILYKTFTFKIRQKEYKILSIAWAISIFSHEMGGFSFHQMQALVFFSVFAALFNAIEYQEKIESKS